MFLEYEAVLFRNCINEIEITVDNIFPSLDAVKKQPKRESEFAKSNSLASWVCSRAIEIALQRPEAQWLAGDRPLRKLQSAFFMMGARLPSYRESDQSQVD